MKRSGTVLLLLAATPCVLASCLFFGAAGIGLPRLGEPAGRAIVLLRLYRVSAGFVIGAGLSCAGAVLQALLRNPLAEPYVLGVSGGAGLGAAVAIATGLAAVSPLSVPAAAFVAAAATLALVYALGSSGGRISIYGLVLSGVIVSSLCSSLLMFIVALVPADGLHSILWWMLGNLQVSDRALFFACVLLIVPSVLGIWAMSRELNALTLGQEMAHHLGLPTGAVIAGGLALSTLITGAAVGMAGLIGFVGLIVPHVVRSLTGPDHRRLVPASALFGGMFLAVSDAVARTVLAPREIPVGVVTSLVGAPFFLFILRRRRRRGWVA